MTAPPLRSREAAKALNISYARFRARRVELERLGILVEALPRLDAYPRYLAAPIERYASGGMRAQALKQTLGARP